MLLNAGLVEINSIPVLTKVIVLCVQIGKIKRDNFNQPDYSSCSSHQIGDKSYSYKLQVATVFSKSQEAQYGRSYAGL